jgi:hypothetical protein
MMQLLMAIAFVVTSLLAPATPAPEQQLVDSLAEPCWTDFYFDQSATVPIGAAGTVPADELLYAAFNNLIPENIEREWSERCESLHAQNPAYGQGREDSLQVSVGQTYGGQQVVGWALWSTDTLGFDNVNYDTRYILLDSATGGYLGLDSLVPASQFAAATVAIEGYIAQELFTGLSDSSVEVPTGYLDRLSIGYGDDGLLIFGWLPEVLGTFPVSMVIPWDQLSTYSFRK